MQTGIHNRRGMPVPVQLLSGTGSLRTSANSPLFWQLWQRHQETLYEISFRLMAGSITDAEDALNTAMLRAFQGFVTQAEPLASEKAWLIRVLYNVCMDFHRERRRFGKRIAEETELEPSIPPPAELAPDELLMEQERAREIRECIDALPPNLRKPIEMRFLENMSYADIARHLQLTNCNVRKRVQQAKDLLRVSLLALAHSG